MRKRSLVTIASALVALGITSGATAQAVDGAKALFFEQEKQPDKPINLGLKYWIERTRNGSTRTVSNRAVFNSGDKIVFHVKTNFNGYAYILMKSGSRGEKNVLFPDEKAKEDNHIELGKDYQLPSDGKFVFDKNPGTEKICLVLSRNKVDAEAYLAKPHESTQIASSKTGSKDLIPVHVLVAFNAAPMVQEEESSPPPAVKSKPVKAAASDHEKPVHAASAPKVKPVAASSPPKAVHAPKAAEPVKVASAPRVTPPVQYAATSIHEEDVVTVVDKNPTGVLQVDIALDHR